MEPVAYIIDLAVPVVIIVLCIGAVFLVFCYASVWRRPLMPTRWGDIAWKRVDYVWIIAGSVVLVIQAVTMNGDSKLSELIAEKNFLGISAQGANMDAARLSDSHICLPVRGETGAALDEAMIELDEACKRFREIKPANPTDLILDIKLARYKDSGRISDDEYNHAEIKQRVQRLNESLDQYSDQQAKVKLLSGQIDLYNKALKAMQMVSYVMLVLAAGLRLAKVKGEITLKKEQITQKEKDFVSRDELSHALDDLISRNQLNALERKIGILELMLKRVVYGAGGLVVIMALLSFYIIVTIPR